MDVEAQVDGTLAKIVVPNGTQNVKVGKIIAMLAEEGDDISSIKVPAEDSQNSATSGLGADGETAIKAQEQSKEPEQKESQDHKKPLHFDTTYSPAVLRLLQEHAIEDPKLIPTTGPQGRLLKGDVLAHVGSVKGDVPKALKDILAKNTRLDLSNITLQQSQPPQSHSRPSIHHPTKPLAPAHINTVVRLTNLFKIQRQLSG